MLNKDGPIPVEENTSEKKKPPTNFYIPRALAKRGPLWSKAFKLPKDHGTDEK